MNVFFMAAENWTALGTMILTIVNLFGAVSLNLNKFSFLKRIDFKRDK